jgi:hypothetical protein
VNGSVAAFSGAVDFASGEAAAGVAFSFDGEVPVFGSVVGVVPVVGVVGVVGVVAGVVGVVGVVFGVVGVEP